MEANNITTTLARQEIRIDDHFVFNYGAKVQSEPIPLRSHK